MTHNVKYLKDLPYTRLGKHVHLAASARMLVNSTRLTCVDDDTVYLDGERRHAISFTVRFTEVCTLTQCVPGDDSPARGRIGSINGVNQT